MKKILFINFGGLGDEILFLPTIESVKKEFPDSHITLALEERSKRITQLTDVIDEVLFANIKQAFPLLGRGLGRGLGKVFNLTKLLIKIWNKKFDIVISAPLSANKKLTSLLIPTRMAQM